MDKNILNLDENEYIVYEKEQSYVFFKDEEVELYITNLNLILVNETMYMFKKSTYDITKWPVNDIKVIDKIPQITIENDAENAYWNIVMLFNRGIKKIGLYYGSVFKKNEVKKEVELLAKKLQVE
jgi:hypothetical protein